MLGQISAVTITVPALAPIEHAYTTHLGMRVLTRGKISAATAQGWGAPAIAGGSTMTLVPESGEQTCLRFIEDEAAGTSTPFTSFGWNAAELTVQNTDVLAARLRNSPFKIIGEPANLKGFDWIRAMQVLGPSGECLYLTDVSTDPDLAHAGAMVGQVFIVVAAGPDMNAMRHFYSMHFSNNMSDTFAIPIGVVNRANDLPPSTRHKLALVELPGGTRIELDEYPPSARQRQVCSGHLPPGISMVTFPVGELPLQSRYMADLPPFIGKQSVCLRGAAGELIELAA